VKITLGGAEREGQGKGRFLRGALRKALCERVSRRSRRAICIRDNLHLCAANWLDRDRHKKKGAARVFAVHAAPRTKWRNEISRRTMLRPGAAARERAHLQSAAAQRCAVLKLTRARARVYPAAFTTRRPSGIPDEITRRTADIRAELMHVFNSTAQWSPHCREWCSTPGKLLPVNPRWGERCPSRGSHLARGISRVSRNENACWNNNCALARLGKEDVFSFSR